MGPKLRKQEFIGSIKYGVLVHLVHLPPMRDLSPKITVLQHQQDPKIALFRSWTYFATWIQFNRTFPRPFHILDSLLAIQAAREFRSNHHSLCGLWDFSEVCTSIRLKATPAVVAIQKT
ncbi:lea domain protein [Moniliophthora roreri]|nr:lea domain protein [Moniliophthora roreri]